MCATWLPARQLPAIRQEGKVAVEPEVMFLDEPASLTLLAKSEVLQRHRHDEGVIVIRLEEIDLLVLDTGHLERSRRRLEKIRVRDIGQRAENRW